MRTNLLIFKRWYRYIPTSLTLGNSLCGFTAILCTLQVYSPEQGEDVRELLSILHAHLPEPGDEVRHLMATSAWLIVGAMIFDLLDGWTARMLKANSEHGVQMDSLADMVTFGVAPAVMVAVMAHTEQLVVLSYHWVWLLTAIYLACVALRLALYNVQAMRESEASADAFSGLPSPGAAAALSSLVLLYADPTPDPAYEYVVLAQIMPFYAAVLGALMVSPIAYPHLGRWLGSKRKYRLKMLALIIFFLLFSWQSRLVAAIAINLYVLFGPTRILVSWLLRRLQRRPAD